MKKLGLLIMIGLLATTLVGCIQTTQANQETIYENELDGYTIQIPASWKDKYTIVEASRSADFVYKSENPEHHQSLFRIFVVSEEEWTAIQEEGPLTIHEIVVDSGNAYLYVYPLDSILNGDEATEYQEMVKDIAGIIESFQLK